jgi:hypothetical protein
VRFRDASVAFQNAKLGIIVVGKDGNAVNDQLPRDAMIDDCPDAFAPEVLGKRELSGTVLDISLKLRGSRELLARGLVFDQKGKVYRFCTVLVLVLHFVKLVRRMRIRFEVGQ